MFDGSSKNGRLTGVGESIGFRDIYHIAIFWQKQLRAAP
jgi:hypothetical protein